MNEAWRLDERDYKIHLHVFYTCILYLHVFYNHESHDLCLTMLCPTLTPDAVLQPCTSGTMSSNKLLFN